RRHTRSKRDWSSDVCSSDLNSTPSPTTSSKPPRAPWSSVSPDPATKRPKNPAIQQTKSQPRSPKGGPEKCPIFLSRILPHVTQPRHQSVDTVASLAQHLPGESIQDAARPRRERW